jgi:hypothetical protein
MEYTTNTLARAAYVSDGVDYDSYTKLVCSFDGSDGDTTDTAETGQTITFGGTAQLDTAQKKFGTSALLLNGNSDYVSVPDSTDWFFDTGDFTIDCWVRWNALPTSGNRQKIITQSKDGSNRWYFGIWNNGGVQTLEFRHFPNSGTADIAIVKTTSVSINTWYHLALVRNGNNWMIFKDGSQQGTTEVDAYNIDNIAGALYIGVRKDKDEDYFNGWIDEVRVTKGLARWTTTFTPDTQAYPLESGYIMQDFTSTTHTQGSYSLKTVAIATESLNKTLTYTPASPINLTDKRVIHFYMYASRTGSNIKIGIHDSGGTTTETTPNITSANTWQSVLWDISAVTNANKDAIDSIIVTVTNADADNTFYIDNMYAGEIVYVDTSNPKFGTGSGRFYSDSILTTPDHADFYFAEKPFTMDFWVKFGTLSTTSSVMFYQQESGAGYTTKLWLNSETNLKFLSIDNNTTKADYSCSWTPMTGEFKHVALTRHVNGTGTAIQMFIDGISQAVTSVTAVTTSTLPNLTTPIYIGGDFTNKNFPIKGWLDEYRITKNVARWTSNFTPPINAYNDATGGYLHQDFETFLDHVLGCDINNMPWKWLASSSTASNMTVVSGLTGSKFIKKFQNYCVMANVKISGIRYPSRWYWSNIKTIDSWTAYNFIEVSKDDGDEIMGVKELGDRLVFYKNNSIYLAIFTGDADIPFIMQKSNSAVGCAAPYSIQANENGHIFASYDGVYFFDGFNSYKMSDRINDIYAGFNTNQFENAVSMYQNRKNKYWLGVSNGTSAYNNYVLTWDSFLNAWSKYSGFSTSVMTTFMVNGTEERPYFGDYNGYTYRADYGLNDYSLNTKTAIDAYFCTNWKHFDDICDNKGVPHVYVVHRNESNTMLTMDYSYDFYNGDQYTQTFSLFTTQTVSALTTRRDLTGRGKFVMLKFGDNATDTTFRIDGIGTYVTKESKS